MAFMGETIDIGVADLLSVLASRRHSGRLAITADGDEVQLYLDHGKLISVSSSNHGLRLGRTLVRLGLLESTRLDAAVRDQEVDGQDRPLGQILVDFGWVTREDLARGAEEQCVEALTRVIVAKHGTFMFSRDTPPRTQTGLASLNTDGIVLEASRRADEMVTLRSLLPAPAATLSLKPPGPTDSAGLSDLETQVIAGLRGATSSLAALAQRLPVEEMALWRTIISLRERGIVVTKGADGVDEHDGDEDRVAARTVDEVVALGLARQSGRPLRAVPALAEVRAGTLASAQTVAAITLVVREVIASFNAGLPLRAFAHFSDDHFRRQGALGDAEIQALQAPAYPLPPKDQETVVAVRDVRGLPDGRVSAILISHYVGVGEIRRVLVFVRIDARWQIDAVVEAPIPTSLVRGTAGPSQEVASIR